MTEFKTPGDAKKSQMGVKAHEVEEDEGRCWNRTWDRALTCRDRTHKARFVIFVRSSSVEDASESRDQFVYWKVVMDSLIEARVPIWRVVQDL